MTTAMSPHLPFLQPLGDALSEALVASWQDVMPLPNKGLIHIEYESLANQPINWIRVLSSTKWGYWNVVCEYSMREQPLGEVGLHFKSGCHSASLSESLNRIMQHQEMFTAPEIARHGLIQVSPPGATN